MRVQRLVTAALAVVATGTVLMVAGILNLIATTTGSYALDRTLPTWVVVLLVAVAFHLALVRRAAGAHWLPPYAIGHLGLTGLGAWHSITYRQPDELAWILVMAGISLALSAAFLVVAVRAARGSAPSGPGPADDTPESLPVVPDPR